MSVLSLRPRRFHLRRTSIIPSEADPDICLIMLLTNGINGNTFIPPAILLTGLCTQCSADQKALGNRFLPCLQAPGRWAHRSKRLCWEQSAAHFTPEKLPSSPLQFGHIPPPSGKVGWLF